MTYTATFQGFKIPKGDKLIQTKADSATYTVEVFQLHSPRISYWTGRIIGAGRLDIREKAYQAAQVQAAGFFVKQLTEWDSPGAPVESVSAAAVPVGKEDSEEEPVL